MVRMKKETQPWSVCSRTGRAFQSCVLKGSSKNFQYGDSRLPPDCWVSFSLTSCDIWVQSFFWGVLGDWGKRWWALHGAPSPLSLNRITVRTEFWKLGFNSRCCILPLWVCLVSVPKLAGLGQEAGSVSDWNWFQGPGSLTLLLWKREWRWEGGASMCGQLSKGGVSEGLHFFSPREFGVGRRCRGGHSFQSHPSSGSYGKRYG